MNNAVLSKLTLALASVLVAPLISAQSDVMPRTEYGTPDFQGIYPFRTITPLNRPRELENKATLTPEEAKEWEDFGEKVVQRDNIYFLGSKH